MVGCCGAGEDEAYKFRCRANRLSHTNNTTGAR